MSKMSKNKGKVGEREAAAFIRECGFEAKRGVQYRGGENSPDVVHSIPNLHVEVKRVERLNINTAMEQARNDAGTKIPVVMHRINRNPWLITLDARAFFELLQRNEHA